ncbi:MAG: cohesin domain-containing protein [bacterium]
MYSKRLIKALVAEVIVIAAVIGLNFRCLMAQSNPEGNIYLYDETLDRRFKEELKLYTPTIWENIKELEEVELVTSEKAYSVVILMHPYTEGAFDLNTAEWVVVVSSIPEIEEEVKITIVRLDYRSFDLKRIDKFTYPVEKELNLEEVIPLMEEELRLNYLLAPLEACLDPVIDPDVDRGCSVHKEDVQLLGGNYICSSSIGDFYGKIFINKYAGKTIFFASTAWMGTGGVIIPPCTPATHERNIYIKGIGTTGKIGKEVRIPVRIENTPCEVHSFDFEVTYDPDTFEYTGMEQGELAESFAAIEAYSIDSARLRIGGQTDGQGISQGASGYLVWLKFKLKSVKEGAAYLFKLENLGSDIANFSKTGGIFCMRCNEGDVNGDGFITPGDALLAFKCYLGTGPCLECSDLNRDGVISPEDAHRIFLRYIRSRPCLGIWK